MKVLVVGSLPDWKVFLEDYILIQPHFELVFVSDTSQASEALLDPGKEIGAVLLCGGKETFDFVRTVRKQVELGHLRVVMLTVEDCLEREALFAGVDVFHTHWENNLRQKIPAAFTGS